MSTLSAIRRAAAELAFRRHLNAVTWHRHCASRGYPDHGRFEAGCATARYDTLCAYVARCDGLRIVAGRPL